MIDVTLGITAIEKKTGEYWLYIPRGAKRLTVKHDKLGILRNYVYTIPIKEATVYELVLTTAKVTTIVEEYEVPTQWLVVSSEPDAADVFINEQYVGVTPYTKKMEIGKYAYRIEKSMYHTEAGQLELTETGRKTLNANLKPNFGYVKVNTLPEQGASLEIDGIAINSTTPYNSQKLISGTHRLSLKKVMFKPKTIDFTIADGQTNTLNIDLEPNFASINITTTPEADIYIDDERKAYGTYTGRLNPGLHTFEARKNKHYSDKKQQEFTAGETVNISLHTRAKTGKLDVTSTPFDATIKLNGKNYGTTPNTLKDLLIGDYTLALEKQGYGTISKTISITENQTASINETLPSGKQITINSRPQGATLYIAGVSTGSTPYTATLAFGSHKLKLVNGKKTVEQNITISQSGKTSFSFDVSENSFTDKRDGKTYKTVKIGTQTWMAENLNYKTTESYCYDDNESNCQKYGRLYTWKVAKNACPAGWHLPTDNEWKQLEKHLGMSQTDADYTGWRGTNEGKELKATNGWKNNGNGTDIYGFTALPGGFRGNNGNYGYVGSYGYWWSAPEGSPDYDWYRVLGYSESSVDRSHLGKSWSFSVRCLRD